MDGNRKVVKTSRVSVQSSYGSFLSFFNTSAFFPIISAQTFAKMSLKKIYSWPRLTLFIDQVLNHVLLVLVCRLDFAVYFSIELNQL